MAETFNIGDVVRLKSGGPSMTVAEVGDIEGQPTVWCTWFENDKNEQSTGQEDVAELLRKHGATSGRR